MEDPELRRLTDKAELSFYQDTSKDALVALKEELYFTIEEKQQEADLTEMGRNFLNPDDPNSFVLPDLLTEFADIETNAALSDSEKADAEGRAPAALRPSGRADAQHRPAAKGLLPLREGCRVCRRGEQGCHC